MKLNSRWRRSLTASIASLAVAAGMLAVASTSGAADETTIEPREPAELVGRLVDARDGTTPLAGAELEAVDEDGNSYWWSDSNYPETDGQRDASAQWGNHQVAGGFRFALNAGTYTIRYTLADEVDSHWVGGDTPTQFDLSAGEYQDAGSVTVTPNPLPKGSVSGTVQNLQGLPRANVGVDVYRQTASDGWTWAGSSDTDGTGAFTVSGVLRDQPLAVCTYTRERYCNGSATPGFPEASDIKIPASGALTLSSPLVDRVTTVTAKVLNADGTPASYEWINLYRISANGPDNGIGASTNASGVATFSNVTPGDKYTVCTYVTLSSACLGGASYQWETNPGPTTFAVPDAGATAPDLTLPAMGRVTGRVVQKSDQAPVAGAGVFLFFRALGGASTYGQPVLTGTDGTFSIPRPRIAANYAVCVGGFDAEFACTTLAGGDPTLASWGDFDTFELTASDDVTPLTNDITVPAPVTVTAKSLDVDGATPTEGRTVAIYRKDADAYGTQYYYQHQVASGPAASDGTFNAMAFGGGEFTACTYYGYCIDGSTTDAPAYKTVAGTETDPVDLGTIVHQSASASCGETKDNGTLALGVGCNGELIRYGYDDDDDWAGTGLRLNNGQDMLAYGAPAEGWGVGDAYTGSYGYGSYWNGSYVNRVGFEQGSADNDDTTTSTVKAANGKFLVQHQVIPSASSNAYLMRVTVTNTSSQPTELRYRRAADFDVPPTPFSEIATVKTGSLPELQFASTDGFADLSPFGDRSTRGGAKGDVANSGPRDQGALMDFDFGVLEAGSSKTFTLAYGAAESKAAAEEVLTDLGAKAYILNAGSSTAEGAQNQAAFLAYGVTDEAGSNAPVTTTGAATVARGTSGNVDVLANATDPNGKSLEVVEGSGSGAKNGSVTCSTTSCTYTPFEDTVAKSDSFRYTVKNSDGLTAIGRINVTITQDETPAPQLDTAPSLDGTAKAGEELALTPATWKNAAGESIEPASLTTQWQVKWSPFKEAFDANDYDYTVVPNEDGTYTIPSWLQGAYLRVVQTAKGSANSIVKNAVASNMVGPVAGTPYLYATSWPGFGSKAQVGKPIAAPTPTWGSIDENGFWNEGVTPDSREYAWYVNGQLVDDATESTYTPSEGDAGKTIQVSVTAKLEGYVDGYFNAWGNAVLAADATVREIPVHVTSGSGDAAKDVAGAFVELCDTTSWSCDWAETDSNGVVNLDAVVTEAGQQLYYYVGSTYADGAQKTLSTWANVDGVTADQPEEIAVTVKAFTPPPPNVELPKKTAVVSNGYSFTATCDDEPTAAVITFPGGQTQSMTISDGDADNTYVFSVTKLEHSGNSSVKITGCTTETSTEDPDFVLYIDPSGIVTDQYGVPIKDATATLMRLGGEGQFAAVANGDGAIMDPAVNTANPSLTDDTGFFRWDVANGTYRVDISGATSGGKTCAAASTPSMQVPPERIDLLIKLSCADAPAPAPKTAPAISGEFTVGKTLTVSTGAWGNSIAQQSIQWTADGTAIGGATGTTYTLTANEANKVVTAVVTAKRGDYTQENGAGAKVVFDSFTYTVAQTVKVAAASSGGGGGGGGAASPSPTPSETATATPSPTETATATPTPEPEQPVKTHTGAGLKKSTVKAGQRAVLKVKVEAADGSPVKGKVQVKLGKGAKAKVITRKIKVADDGTLKIKLPKLKPGKYKVTVTFLGNDGLKKSSFGAGTLTVVKKGKATSSAKAVTPRTGWVL